jgi:hypothetical protein
MKRIHAEVQQLNTRPAATATALLRLLLQLRCCGDANHARVEAPLSS